MFQANGIRVDFGGVRAVDDVSLAVGAGESLGLIGPNGSGKTTLLNVFTGVVKATGDASLDGQPLPLGRPRRLNHLGISRVFQAPQVLHSLTCLENVLAADRDRRLAGYVSAVGLRPAMLGRERDRWRRAREALERVGLDDLAGSMSGALPYGQQRLLEVARAIMARPRLLLLDEPSAGLNDAESAALSRTIAEIRDDGAALIIVDHKLDFVERLCPQLVVMDFGRVIARGAPEQVWQDPRVVEAYLGVVDA